jgi:hypothetical protein
VKTITIRLPDVEAAMLVEIQKCKKEFVNPEKFLLAEIRKIYEGLCGR